MFKKWFCFLGLAIGIAIPTFAQDNSAILLQVGNEKVEAEEFWAIYKKNSRINQQSEKTSIDDYLDLYINFKLKVKEAKDAKLDTSASFIKELEGYRKQLVKPYLVIEEVNEQAIRDAYERMKTNVRARHILFRLAENASPKDTLAVYEKSQEVRNQIISGKLTFVQAALQYSEDPSARDMDMGEGRPVRPGNKGDLGYFGVFDMVYPFEEATFNLDLNEISAPTRTRFGYHLIQLTDKIPAIGQVKAAHIFIQKSNPDSRIDSAKVRIDELYAQIENGVPFEKVVLESDDKGSSSQGGELPMFTANRMVPQFIEAISKLKIGEVSAPVQTSFGWHIIKFIEQKPIDSFDKVKE
ncbi:MAG: peptidylprolyl isomerase, partial [Bacteroidales bacterium]|nr:peptidylprolyl isomerase [Bacteroidales bacterium]